MLSRPIGAALLFLVVGGLVTVAAMEARAADAKTSSLSWLRMPGADGCVATQPLARAIEERLGRAVFVSAAQADLSVEGRIEKRPRGAGGWHAVITVRDSNGVTLGTRELDRPDASCDAMTEPLALIVAVMIDPDAAMRPKPAPSTDAAAAPTNTTTTSASAAPTEPPPPPPPPSSTGAASSGDRPPRAPPPKTDPWRFEGTGALTTIHGLTPTTAFGAGVQAILYPPKIPVGFRGYTTLFLPTDAEKDGARASFDMLYVGGGLCPTLRRRVSLMGCLGGQVGVLRPRSETANRGISENLIPIWNALLELRLHVPIVSPIGASAGVGAGIPIFRPRLDYTTRANTPDTLHRADAFILTADLGIGFFFP